MQDVAVAEDLTQEVFVTVFKTILSFREQSSLGTWLYRIAVNKSLDYLRAKNRRQKAGLFSAVFQRNDAAPETADKNVFTHPGVKLERKEEAHYLYKAINSLNEQQKTAFVLCFIEELPQKEIAEIMNVSVKAVESLLQRAKSNLRKYLSETDVRPSLG